MACIYTINGEEKSFNEYIEMLYDMDDVALDGLIAKGSITTPPIEPPKSEDKPVKKEQAESKFNMRQRLGIPVNEAMQNLADNDRLMYDKSTNEELLKEANQRIEADIDKAYEFAIQDDPKASELTGMFATAGRLIPLLESAIKNAASADAKAYWVDKLDALRKATRKQATIGGQAVQALATVGNIMPLRDAMVNSITAQRSKLANEKSKKSTIKEDIVKDTKETVAKAIDNIVNNDPKVKELEAKIIELEGKIAGKKKAKRDEVVKNVVSKLESLKFDGTYSDPFLFAKTTNSAISLVQTLIKKGTKVSDAIDKAVAHINHLSKGVKWDEQKFRDGINNAIGDNVESLDSFSEEKQAILKARKQLKDSIRTGLVDGDFTNLETLLASKEMDTESIEKYISDLQKKHESEVIYAVHKRIQKNLGLSATLKPEKSAVLINLEKEPLTEAEITARLKKEIDVVSAKVDKLRKERIDKNVLTKEELEAKKKLEELEKAEKEITTGQLAKQILATESLTEDEVTARLKKKKDDLDDKIAKARQERINKNVETTKEKELRTEQEKVDRAIKEQTDTQIAKKIAKEEPLTEAEITAIFKKQNKLEDLTKDQENRLKELYDEVDRVKYDPDLKKEALNNLRHEAQKLIPKEGIASFMNAYDSIWYYPSILSGHMTQIANFADALMNSMTFDVLSKVGRESFKDQFRGLKSASDKAKIGIREGFLSEGILNNGVPDKMNLSIKTSEDFAKEGNKIAKATKWVGRIMSIPNTFGETIRFNALSNIIQRDLISQNITGRELKDRKNELLFGTKVKMPEYEAKAVDLVYGKEERNFKDVLKEAKVRRTISNLVLQDMQDAMTTIEGKEAIEISERIKDLATYQNKATGVLSIMPKLANLMEGLSPDVGFGKVPIGEAIKFVNKKMLRIDFLNTIVNIANAKLNYTPYGYLRANNVSTGRILKSISPVMGQWLEHPDYTEAKNYEEKRRILHKANVGTTLVVAIGAGVLYGVSKDEDDDENKHRFITGDLMPSDFMKMATKFTHEKEAGKALPPNSIYLPVVGWTNYMLTPFAGAFSMLGNWSDRMYANKHIELTAKSMAVDAGWASLRSVKSILLDGTPLGTQLEANRPSKMTTTDNLAEQVATWGMTKLADIAGANVPNLVKSIGKQIDPTLYTPKDLPTIMAKQLGLLNWYSALGGELKTGYAVDLLGNKIGTKSGERYFNLLLEEHQEDKKYYDLLIDVYKEPMNFPSLLRSDMSVPISLMNEEEYNKKVNVITSKFESGDLTLIQMQNSLDVLQKASKKIDDIGTDPLLYSKALEYCGKRFKSSLIRNEQKIKNMSNTEDRKKYVTDFLEVAKNLTKIEFSK